MSKPSRPLRVLVVGALGRMGERVRAVLAEEADLELAAALEAAGHRGVGERFPGGVTLTDDPKQALSRVDVAVDFSLPGASLRVLRVAADAGRPPCVIGTTGFAPEERAELERLAARVAVVLAPNFSVAVNVLGHLAREATRLLGESFDAEIVELHHAAKRDAPSGTALRLGAAIGEARALPDQARVLTREGETGPRPRGAIGIQALRGGDNPGEHTVLFLGRGERLELTHRATSRDPYVSGALRAARWVVGRPPGLYDMDRVLGLSPAGRRYKSK